MLAESWREFPADDLQNTSDLLVLIFRIKIQEIHQEFVLFPLKGITLQTLTAKTAKLRCNLG